MGIGAKPMGVLKKLCDKAENEQFKQSREERRSSGRPQRENKKEKN